MCADLGVSTGRVEGRSGVWLPADATRPARKIAAIGIRVARHHAARLALNCDCDLSAYNEIVPCGIVDAGVPTAPFAFEEGYAVLPVLNKAVFQLLAVGECTSRKETVFNPDAATDVVRPHAVVFSEKF